MACDENYRHNDSHICAIFMQVSEHPCFSPLKLRVLTIKMNVQKLRIKKIAPAWFLMLSHSIRVLQHCINLKIWKNK